MDAEHPAAVAFRRAVEARDAARVRELFFEEPGLREVVDAPLFAFGGTALNQAAFGPDRELIEALLDGGADPDAKSDWPPGPYGVLDTLVDRKPPLDQELADHLVARGVTLDLHAAAGLGRTDVVRRLLDEAPERINEPGPDGATALHLASTVETAELLLERGADLEQRCVDHRSTPIMWSTNGRPEVTRLLLDRGATPDLFVAAYLDDRELAERILEREPSAIEARVRFGRSHEHIGFGDKYLWTLDFADTPIEVARRRGSETVHALLLERSSVRVQLLQAARSGDLDEIQRLASADPALVESLDEDESRGMLLGTLEAARLLLTLGVDPDARDELSGATAAHDAAWNGDAARLEVLLDAGASVGIRDRNHSSTPLGWANHAGNRELVDRLASEPTVDLADAAWLGRADRVAEILAADPDAARDGEAGSPSPLRAAAHHGHAEVVELLLAHGADPAARHPETGQTALDLAVAGGHDRVVELLRGA